MKDVHCKNERTGDENRVHTRDLCKSISWLSPVLSIEINMLSKEFCVNDKHSALDMHNQAMTAPFQRI